ncbi:MAG: DinB family protein [Acidobacteria bacterium]|nr:DinB family protein [Acidobacteriota bacterium]
MPAIVAAGEIPPNAAWRSALWQQSGAAIDMLDNAVAACPEALWSDRSQTPAFWYVAFHTIFFLDFYVSESPDGFAPPSPFTLSEFNPEGELPERPYTKQELRGYLRHSREKCRRSIETLSDERARERTGFLDGSLGRLELLFYNLRHVQHHAGQLNLLLRQKTQSAPRWVLRAREEAESP